MDLMMRDLINNWTGSNKYQEFKAKLVKRKNELFISKQETMKEPRIFETIKQLETAIEERMKLANNEMLDFMFEVAVNRIEKDKHYDDFVVNLTTWYYYLHYAIRTEQFELAAKLRDCILLEIVDFRNLLELHLEWDESEDDQNINEIDLHLKTFYHICS